MVRILGLAILGSGLIFGGRVVLSGRTIVGAKTAEITKTGKTPKTTESAKTADVITVVSRPDLDAHNTFYQGNRAPLEPLSFIELPIGSIRPAGWIRRYLELQRDGLTGHLDEISGWLDKKNNAWYSGTGKGDHGWEEVPYWLKGYGDLAYDLRDSGMIRKTEDWLNKVFESQQPDGYFGPSVVENEHQRNGGATPDLWPNMLMLWCMQSYYSYSRDPRVIPFMRNYFRWESTVPDSMMLKLYWENSRAGDNLYSVYWLYDITGEPWLLDLARKIHRNTANWCQDTTLPNWHNVNIAQCFREPATYFMQTRDSSFLDATYKDFALVRALYGQVPGGMFGADENARKGYTDPRQAVETCGMVEQMASDELLTGITGDPSWADNCEDVAFNTYPAAVMPDFRGLRYLTAPNMVVSDTMNHSPGIQNGGPFLVMNPFSSRCCQHNHSQGWPYYAEHLWMATPDNGLGAVLYNACTVRAKVGEGEAITIKEDTHYPFEDTIRIWIEEGEGRFPMYLRIPGWCTGAEIAINGQPIEKRPASDKYVRIERDWKPGDKVEVYLPMQIKLHTWTENKNSVSVDYGPLTFSLKIKETYHRISSKSSAQDDAKWQANVDTAEWPAYEIFPASPWNYGLVAWTKMELIRRPWPKDDFPFSLRKVPLEIKTQGVLIPDWTIDQYGLCGVLPQSPVIEQLGKLDAIELVPMGAARLRISAFPAVAEERKEPMARNSTGQ